MNYEFPFHVKRVDIHINESNKGGLMNVQEVSA